MFGIFLISIYWMYSKTTVFMIFYLTWFKQITKLDTNINIFWTVTIFLGWSPFEIKPVATYSEKISIKIMVIP